MKVRSAGCAALLGMALAAAIVAIGRVNEAAGFLGWTVQLVVLFPVGGTTDNQNILVVNPRKVPGGKVGELIEYLKKNPGNLTFASSGIGGATYLAAQLCKRVTGAGMVHVPCRGNALATNDLVAGNVDLAIDNMASMMLHVSPGTTRALGAATVKRMTLALDIPAVAETVPGFEAQTWNGIVVRMDTPKDIVAEVAADFNAAIRQADATPVGSSPRGFSRVYQCRQGKVGACLQSDKAGV